MKKRKRKTRRRCGVDEGSYVCPNCGETIVIPVDVSAGEEQRYIEDCPVCCHANVIYVELMEGEEARVWAEGE